LPFVPYVIGVLKWDWGFNELSGLFLVAGFAIGLASGRGPSDTAVSYLKAMEGMLAAALFVGVARGISVALTDGKVLDTILYSLATPLSQVSGSVAMVLMVPMQALLHIPVPSMSGQAVLTMPIMAPLCDLLGRSRDAAVIAYQTGAGLMDMITPTTARCSRCCSAPASVTDAGCASSFPARSGVNRRLDRHRARRLAFAPTRGRAAAGARANPRLAGERLGLLRRFAGHVPVDQPHHGQHHPDPADAAHPGRDGQVVLQHTQCVKRIVQSLSSLPTSGSAERRASAM
jgi:hypothetical protein